MSDSVSENLGKVIQIDEEQIQQHLVGEMVRGTVEETINKLLDAEADRDLGAGMGFSLFGASYPLAWKIAHDIRVIYRKFSIY